MINDKRGGMETMNEPVTEWVGPTDTQSTEGNDGLD